VDVRLRDGVSLWIEDVGDPARLPLFVLHGGPGLDHQHMRPWLDPLSNEVRLLYVDERGQGRSERVDPASLSLDVFARDVDLAAEALAVERFALLGHSFGAIVATHHAVEHGTAAAYVISGGSDSSERLAEDVAAALGALGDGGQEIARSWEQEQTVGTDEELAELIRVQMPFHFHHEPPAGFAQETVWSPEVLRHFARAGYGDFDFVPLLHRVHKPVLVIVGEHDRTTTPRAARVLHEGIEGSTFAVVPDAGHMSFVEAQDAYLDAVRGFLQGIPQQQPHGS
jgi:proline iminopeptidase